MADKISTITTWCGRDIRELTREELIEALAASVRQYQDMAELAMRRPLTVHVHNESLSLVRRSCPKCGWRPLSGGLRVFEDCPKCKRRLSMTHGRAA